MHDLLDAAYSGKMHPIVGLEALPHPLLTVHRMKKVELTDRSFEFPEKYDFEKTFNLNFGIIKEKS